MGLLGGLLSLPIAPFRGMTWVIEQVVDEAAAQHGDPRRIRAELAAAEAALMAGDIDETEYETIERRLLDRLG